MYALLAWGVSSPSWRAQVSVFLTFGASRSVPVLLSAAQGARDGRETRALELAQAISAKLGALELAVLAALIALSLT